MENDHKFETNSHFFFVMKTKICLLVCFHAKFFIVVVNLLIMAHSHSQHNISNHFDLCLKLGLNSKIYIMI